MASPLRRIQQLRPLIEAQGFHIISYRVTGGGHLRIEVQDARTQGFIIVGLTPSDHRADHNIRTNLTRLRLRPPHPHPTQPTPTPTPTQGHPAS
jgi:hypothetical protein